MQIVSAFFTAAPAIANVAMDTGELYAVDTTLPPDEQFRRMLADWVAAGGVIAPYVAPETPVPSSISDRQFAQGLAIKGLITQQEAEDWVGPGTVPTALLSLVDQLPEADRFAARMLLRGATSFERAHPLTAVLAAAYGWSDEQADQFWRNCAQL